MHWEDLTSLAFAEAVRTAEGVCIVPIGVVEKHGGHMPLGPDFITAHQLAGLATQIVPAVIFPAYYFTQNHEAKHLPGAIAISYRLMYDLLDNVCSEISRNGLKKIVFLNGHGGNSFFLQHFLRASLEKRLDYTLFCIDLRHYTDAPNWKSMAESGYILDHAGEWETSLFLALRPDLVHMDAIAGDGKPQGRLAHLDGLNNGINWYANQPDHYHGDATLATAAKGAYLRDHAVQRIAHYLRIVRADTTTAALINKFHDQTQQA